MEQYFYKLNATDDLSFVREEIASRSDWINRYSFDMLVISPDKFINHSLFNLIRKFRGYPQVLKTNPMYWYEWHTDVNRQCAINCLIEGSDSKCLFRQRETSSLFKYTELVYEPSRYYLFNTQESHALLNGNNVRYMLSIGFKSQGRRSYQDLLAYCKENNL